MLGPAIYLVSLLLINYIPFNLSLSVKDCKSTLSFLHDCRNRGLYNVPYDVFHNPEDYIKLGNNPFICDCSMIWFMREPRNRKENVIDLDSMRCAEPKKLAKKKIIDLKEKEVCSAAYSRVAYQCLGHSRTALLDCYGIKPIPSDIFAWMSKFKKIMLDIFYTCDCRMVWFVRRITESKTLREKILDVDNVRCDGIKSPEKLQYKQVIHLTEQDLCPQKVIDAQMSQREADACNINPKPCNEATSTCVNEEKSFLCIDIDECMDKSKHKCYEGEECVNQQDGYKCQCKPGLVKADNGIGCVALVNPCTKKPKPCNETTSTCITGKNFNFFKCEDIDECALKKHDCHSDAECINHSPGYTCRCKPGFKEYSNGRHCEDINECLGDVDCAKKAKCNNVIGTYNCVCKPGYYGNGKHCNDIDECLTKIYCATNAKCVNTEGSYQCKCKDGFQGNGKVCTDINECSKSKESCPVNAKCINSHGSYTCKCKSGYSYNGEYCVDIDECASRSTHTCDKNALCINNPGGYKCHCKPGFEHFKEGRLCLKEEEQTSNTNQIVIVVLVTVPVCLFFAIVFSTVFLLRRKKRREKDKLSSSKENTSDNTENEQTRLLLEQQTKANEQMFMFPDMTQIPPIVSIISEWSEDEKDYDEDEYEMN